MFSNSRLNFALILGHRPSGGCMTSHLGCDLWPNGDLSVNYDINNSESDCVISLLLQRVGEMLGFLEPQKFFWHKTYRSGFGRQAIFHDFSVAFSESTLTSVSSLLAMDGLETSSSPSGTAPLISEMRVRSASGQPSVGDLAPTFSSCSEGRGGQWGKRSGGSGQSPDRYIRPCTIGNWLFS